MALRTVSRMMITPAMTLQKFTEALKGSGRPGFPFVPNRVANSVVRPMASFSSAAENAPYDENDLKVLKQESRSPATRRSGALGRGSGRNLANTILDIWDPFTTNRSLKQMVDTVDRFFDDPFFNAPTASTYSLDMRTPWDVKEDSEAFRLRVDMPGLSKEEVKVTVEEGELIIKGEHKVEDQSGSNWSTRSYGSYNTRMTLPDNVQLDQLKAEIKNGVLNVVIPKSKEAPKKKVIDIQVE